MNVDLPYVTQLSKVFSRTVQGFNRALYDPHPSRLTDTITADPDVMVRHACDAALIWLNDSEFNVVRPTARFYKQSTGHVAEIILDTLTDENRTLSAVTAAGFAAVVQMADIDGYFVCSEAWVAVCGLDGEVDKLMPSQRMDRMEVVAVSAATRDRHVLRLYPIIRDFERVTLGKAIDHPDVRPMSPVMEDFYQVPDPDLD